MITPVSRAATLAAALLLAACAGVPVSTARHATDELLAPLTARAAAESELQSLLAAPLDANTAVRIALLRNPAIQLQYVELDLAAADVFEASRLANPVLGLGVLWPLNSGSDNKLDGSLTWSLTDWLQWGARRRAGAVQFEAAQQQVAAAIHGLSLDVQEAWLDAVEAQQRAAIRNEIADAARTSAELATQYRAAGNLDALGLALQSAAGSEALIASRRSAVELARAQSKLRQVLGLAAADPPLQLPASLPAPAAAAPNGESLRLLAHRQRLDLRAARNEAAAQKLRADSVRRYRWLGDASTGIAAERDDGIKRAGVNLGLPLPLFQRQQGAVVRSQAQLAAAQLRVQQIELGIDAEIDAQLQQLALLEAQYRECRERLIPQRSAAVEQLMARGNFMLSDPFELLLARQQQYAAHEDAVLALREYWRSRIALARAVGAPLVNPGQEPQS